MDKLEHYLDQVCRGIAGPKALRQHLRQELREHLLDAVAEHRASGLSEEEALTRALQDFGGPEQLGSELATTHGHSLLAVVIDRALEWKERTMKAKWLWTSWAYLALLGVIVVQLLFFALVDVAFLPKLRKLQADGLLDLGRPGRELEGVWLDSVLHDLNGVADDLPAYVLVVVGVWGLFEWLVRSENKPFMRLSALGTAALGLTVALVVVATALVVAFARG